MSSRASTDRVAPLVDLDTVESFDVLGPTIQFLTPPGDEDDLPCTFRGTIPPGVVVPLHSHADPETFLMQSGEVEGLVASDDGAEWVRIGPGEVFHVPGDARHAWRNRSREPAVMFVVTTNRLCRFLRENGTPVASRSAPAGPPSAEAIERFLATAERYGYWNATPEENAEVGLALPAPG
jgi:mannose-6-phosphate isomerase-like protein (cupin superfamily)